MNIFEVITNFYSQILAVFEAHPITIAGIEVSYTAIIFAGLAILMVTGIFWKGAKA